MNQMYMLLLGVLGIAAVGSLLSTGDDDPIDEGTPVPDLPMIDGTEGPDELDGTAWYAWPFSAFLVASVVGMVIGVDRGRWSVLLDGRRITAMRARELSRTPVVVGDRVALVGDTSGDAGTLAVDGDTWSARVEPGAPEVAPGDEVTVLRIDGATLVVRPLPRIDWEADGA